MKLVETLVPFLIQVISGAVGGNVAGAALKNLNLGVLGNTLAGVVGGGIGGQLIALAGAGNIGGLAGDIRLYWWRYLDGHGRISQKIPARIDRYSDVSASNKSRPGFLLCLLFLCPVPGKPEAVMVTLLQVPGVQHGIAGILLLRAFFQIMDTGFDFHGLFPELT